jgi:hypothetical protein
MLGPPNRNTNASQWLHQPKLVTQQNHLADSGFVEGDESVADFWGNG